MTSIERADERDQAEEIRADVLASSLEALQARIEDVDRQALRGAIDACTGPRPEPAERVPGR